MLRARRDSNPQPSDQQSDVWTRTGRLLGGPRADWVAPAGIPGGNALGMTSRTLADARRLSHLRTSVRKWDTEQDCPVGMLNPSGIRADEYHTCNSDVALDR